MKIAAFNVKKLGLKKVNNVFVQEHLIKIVSRYSVVVMLEVMDQSGKAMDKFLSKLNSYGSNKEHPYAMECSESLGRSSYKEKFVYFYREDEVTIIDSYQYKEEEDEEGEDEEEEEEDNDDDDEEDEYENGYEGQEDEYDEEEEEEDDDDDDDDDDGEDEEDEEDDEDEDDEEDNVVDMLEREPFILLLKCPNTVVQKLVLIPVHTKPAEAEIELEAMDNVVKAAKERWRTDKIMILGDFNADGSYLSKKRKAKISICSPAYHWLIDDDVDTTTSNLNDHTYDRIVAYKRTTLRAIVPDSAKPFNFQKAFKLTDKKTQSISDHYPVEVELKTNQKAARQRKTSPPRKTTTKGPQKKKNMTAKRKRGPASDTAAKRRR